MQIYTIYPESWYSLQTFEDYADFSYKDKPNKLLMLFVKKIFRFSFYKNFKIRMRCEVF